MRITLHSKEKDMIKKTILFAVLLSAACQAGYQSAYSGFFALPKAVSVERHTDWKPLSFSAYGLSSSAVFCIASQTPALAGIDVYNVSGKKVKNLMVSIRGEGRASWDLKDSSGRPVAPGIYIARLANAPFPTARVFVILR
jgi:hypothetical protein